MHIHVGVDDLDQSTNFYNRLFGVEPSKVKSDYAKWVLDDPYINFVVSTRVKPGLNHLGLQVDGLDELDLLRSRLNDASVEILEEGETTCCYSRSEKFWTTDPTGLTWEAFQTKHDSEQFSEEQETDSQGCCTAETRNTPGCCPVQTDSSGNCC